MSPCGGGFSNLIAEESAATATATEDIFDGPGTLRAFNIKNAATSDPVFLKLYQGLSADENDEPWMVIPVATLEECKAVFPTGLPFTTGLCMRCTTGAATSDTGSPAGGNVTVTLAATPS